MILNLKVLVSYLGTQDGFDIEIAVQRSRAGPFSGTQSEPKQREAGQEGRRVKEMDKIWDGRPAPGRARHGLTHTATRCIGSTSRQMCCFVSSQGKNGRQWTTLFPDVLVL